MKKFNQKQLILTIIAFLVFASFLTLHLIQTNKDITSPSNTTNVNKFIQVEDGYQNKGSFNTVSVYSTENISILNYFIGLFDKYADIEDHVEYIDMNYTDQITSGTIQKKVSLINSVICAYEFMSVYDNNIKVSYHYQGFIIDTVTKFLSANTLKIGDIITKINGNTVNNGELFTLLKNQTEVNVTFIRNNTEMETTITKNILEINGKNYASFGIDGYDLFNIDEITPEVKYSTNNTLGPSGGLLQTLEIINQLLKFDLTNNQKIVGTGTINIDGTVGQIGGIKQKIIAAATNHAKVFLIPTIKNDVIDTTKIEIIDNYYYINGVNTNYLANSDNQLYIYQGNYYINDTNLNIYAFGNIDYSESDNFNDAASAINEYNINYKTYSVSSIFEAVNLLMSEVDRDLCKQYFSYANLIKLHEVYYE